MEYAKSIAYNVEPLLLFIILFITWHLNTTC